ncbi:Hypothetical predicted protein [Paramuricea clavata]|uniref:Uncharacterized protein n=1 Tax=Paramuricea clavata TaxID=317549 RepID=A0A6S7INA0_PARCT|nr:Hypothetical predicted protein [Paramuricea clavata]
MPLLEICIWWPSVKAFLESLLEEVIIDPSESMLILKNHVDEIMKRSFKGQKLVQGWKLVSQDETNCYWEARDIRDCQSNFEVFVKDTVESLSRRYDICVSIMCEMLTCLHLESIITLLCGKKPDGKPCINEGDLEEYGTEGFKAFISHICSITHVKLAIEDGAIDLDPRLSHIVHRKLKQALKVILWQDRETMINWFDYVPSEISAKIKPLSSVISKDSGNLSSMEKVHECVYSKLGKEICLVIDIALAKGGPETIVESFYSLMKCHKKAGGQNNKNLSLRTKLDWSLPGPF